MAVIHTPETAYAKEKVKWEAHHSPEGAPRRPYRFEEFPSAMYKADRADSGAVIYTGPVLAGNETELLNMQSRGFGQGKKQAYDMLVATEREVAKLAAERAYTERRMSDRAQAEAQAVDASTDAHVPVIPETPIRAIDKAPERRPGGKSKAKDDVVAEDITF